MEENTLTTEEVKPKTLLSVVTDENGYITQFATGGYLGNETAHAELEEIPNDFFSNHKAYKLIDGALTLDTDALESVADENELNALRVQREVECFSVINRGALWYSRLTEEQLSELNDWYNAWLDITETRVIPDRPLFLTEV